MPIVLITPDTMANRPERPYVKMLEEAGFEVRYPTNPELVAGLCSDEETVNALSGISAIIAGGENFNANVLSSLPEMRVIARAGVGFDRVDVPAATERTIAVTITPTANHEAVAEQALTLLLAVAKGIVRGDAAVRGGEWPKRPLKPVRGRTLGILGLGRIGRSMAVRAAGVGMKVIATETYPDLEFVRANNIELVDLDTLLARSDYVTLHCPLNEETFHLFDRTAFAKMKRGAVLVNTARGPLVVESDLHDALESGQLGAAGLDVFEQEPPDPQNPLFKLSNVVLSPHAAGADDDSVERMATESAENIIQLYRGLWPEGAVVNEELKSRWKW